MSLKVDVANETSYQKQVVGRDSVKKWMMCNIPPPRWSKLRNPSNRKGIFVQSVQLVLCSVNGFLSVNICKPRQTDYIEYQNKVCCLPYRCLFCQARQFDREIRTLTRAHFWTETSIKLTPKKGIASTKLRTETVEEFHKKLEVYHTFPSRTIGRGVPWGTGLIRPFKSLTNCKSTMENKNQDDNKKNVRL